MSVLIDCVELMAELEDGSIDAVVCDPPYGLEFMGKEWDRVAQGQAMQDWHERWSVEAFRVLKPGGHLLAFGGTRTYHRLTCAVEDAGFDVRDCIQWLYAQGFPKSLDVGKMIDKRQGWGTALKPANEPIVVARKPLSGTVVANVLAHGTGALNIDATRIATGDPLGGGAELNVQADKPEGWDRPWRNDVEAQAAHAARIRENVERAEQLGRWPANVVLSHDERCVQLGTAEVASDGHFPRARPGGVEVGTVGHAGQDGLDERHMRGETVEVWSCVEGCPVAMLDAQAPNAGGGGFPGEKGGIGNGLVYGAPGSGEGLRDTGRIDANGGASRFFYCAKTSRSERNAGLDAFDAKQTSRWDPTSAMGREAAQAEWSVQRNDHPTVKPIDLMRWLIRLVTPPGGLVLDPFAGSGTTGCAAALEGMRFVGMERDEHYAAIAEARIRFWEEHGDDGLRIVRLRDQGESARKAAADAGQLDLLSSFD